MTNRKRRRRRIDIYFEHGESAAQIDQHLMGWHFFPVHLNHEIGRVAANRIGSEKHSGWIDEKSRAGKFAVLIRSVNFHDRLRASLENRPDLMRDRA